MAITPSTNLKLLKCPLTLDNKNQLTFANAEKQFEYFNSLESLEIDEISYQRKDSVLYYPEHIDNLYEYNYCMYKNENYSNKWFYAFIPNMRYVTDYNTQIFLVTDVFQTWQFDILWKQSFIDREMINVNDDLIGANRINEGLETGEYIIKNSIDISDLNPYYVIAYVGERYWVSENESISIPQTGYKYNGIYSALCFIVCNDSGFIYLMNKSNLQDNSNNILTIFTVPKLGFTIPESSNSWNEKGYYVINENMHTPPQAIDELFSALNDDFSFENYTPKNKKLLQFPYVYLGFNPINGSKKIYKYEDFNENKPSFKITTEINPNPNIYFTPDNYRQENNSINPENVEECSILSGYPTISHKSDTFNTWLAQNEGILKINMQQEQANYQGQTALNVINAGQSAINTANTVMSNADIEGNGNLQNAIMSAVNGIFGSASSGVQQGLNQINHEFYIKQQMAQVEKQRLLPDNATFSSSNATTLGYDLLKKSIFTIYSIRKQFAEKIDKFFDMYGYKTNQIKIPNINNRPNWNYIKTTGANILGDIPQNDLEIIKSMFNNGITLWHNPTTFLDYSQNNR